MMLRRTRKAAGKIWFPALCVVLFAFLIWLGIANRNLYLELREEGKNPVSITPITSPTITKGDKGDRGESLGPTSAQVFSALAMYCSDGRCDGVAPTAPQIAQAVQAYCAAHTCRGEAGKDGSNATSLMVAQAVASYCVGDTCRGPTGYTGSDGPQGPPGVGNVGPTGPQGRAPVLSCVVRTLNNTAVNYIAWRYEDEADLAYRDLYRLPTWAQAEGCIDLRETAA